MELKSCSIIIWKQICRPEAPTARSTTNTRLPVSTHSSTGGRPTPTYTFAPPPVIRPVWLAGGSPAAAAGVSCGTSSIVSESSSQGSGMRRFMLRGPETDDVSPVSWWILANKSCSSSFSSFSLLDWSRSGFCGLPGPRESLLLLVGLFLSSWSDGDLVKKPSGDFTPPAAAPGWQVCPLEGREVGFWEGARDGWPGLETGNGDLRTEPKVAASGHTDELQSQH